MKNVVVTGGSGFVGKALVKKLLSEGLSVTSVSRRDVPELRDAGANVIRADLSEATYSEEFLKALSDADTVFHVAANVDMWGDYRDLYTANVIATRSMLEAARRAGVQRFIYTSSPSVVAGKGDLHGVDENTPYPKKYLAHYPKTKAIAESYVLAAHGQDFNTISLRPHLIFGPGDTNLIPTICQKAREGTLSIIGDGRNLTDVTYISDCVNAHINAAHSLTKNPDCGGRAYFISQGESVPLWEWINNILEIYGLPKIQKKVPTWAAMGLAGLFETAARISSSKGKAPKLTRFLVHQMATTHYFDISAARENLGYTPEYSIAEALDTLKQAA